VKSDTVKDKKWRASFKKMHTHICWVTGQEFVEFGSHSITGAHITIGRYGLGMKDDRYIIPLRQDLHMEMDRGQVEFLIKYFEVFPYELKERAIEQVIKDGKYEITQVVKRMAVDYYENWLAGKLTFQIH